jgi:hypothetical protein
MAVGFCSTESHMRGWCRSRGLTLATRHSACYDSNMADHSTSTVVETKQQKFERILCQEPFKGLKAILDSVCRDQETLRSAVTNTNSYEELLAGLGYRVTMTKQIHVADSYSRTGPAGGIRAVLPYFDIPTQSALPTLVNFDSTVTTTPKSTAFFNRMLAELKRRLEF